MFELINSYMTEFMSFTKENPVASGVVSLWGLGIVTYLCKELPSKIWKFLIEQFTVELEIQCRDDAFYNFLAWYEENGFGKKARTVKLAHHKYRGKETISAGFGSHYFFHNRLPFKLYRYKEEQGSMDRIRESFTLKTIGRSQKPIRDLLESIKPKRDESLETKIYKWEDDWAYLHVQPTRPLSTVIVSSEIESRLLKFLDKFTQDKDWYLKNGIPYRTGICLYGPPGTGKTSLVKAIAGLKRRDLYIINLNIMSDESIQKALETVDDTAILLIEDIDCIKASNSRDDEKNEKKDKLNYLTLSGILNALDGVTSSDGRIVIITTNHLSHLDPALLRPGRIDLNLELSYLTDETLLKALNNFFPDIEFGELHVKEMLTPAEFQNIVIKFKEEPFEILRRVLKTNPTLEFINKNRNIHIDA